MSPALEALRARLGTEGRRLAPGVMVCGLIAVAAQFLSDHYGAPAMLMALLLGLSMHFLMEEGTKTAPGIAFSAQSILRLAVALLGARISAEVVAETGWSVLLLALVGLVATLGFAFVAARALGQGARLAVLTGGAVAICGASAALAIAAVLPRGEASERNLSFTVFGVTLLSTLAMIAYPAIADGFGLSDWATAVFLGATIHDVAQVVGAGFSVSDPVGETATTVKLIRVSLLAPFVLILTLVLRASGQTAGEGKTPILPGFVLGFALLVLLNSFGLIPEFLRSAAETLSRWAMLAAIAAVGIKTELKRMLEIPAQSVVLILAETVFLAALVLAALIWLM